MTTEPITIALPDDLQQRVGMQATSGVLHRAQGPARPSAVLLAHGAGKGMESDFLVTIADGLAAAGLTTLRFNYLYTERMARGSARRPPDRRPVLEDVHRAALDCLRAQQPRARILLAGKSMGGRMSSYLAAAGCECAGLCFLGYPLHAPRKTDKLRADHFGDIHVPALFLQGTRDALCELDLLAKCLTSFGAAHEVHVIEGADHDFKLLKKLERTRDEVLAELTDAIVRFEHALDQ